MNMDSAASLYEMINDKPQYKTQHQNKLYHSNASVVHIANTARYDVCQRHTS